MSVCFSITETTARLFMLKVTEAMSSSGYNSMDDILNLDEYVIGVREETKTGRSYDVKKNMAFTVVQLREDGK